MIGFSYAHSKISIILCIDLALYIRPVILSLIIFLLSCQSEAKTGMPAVKASIIVPAKHSPL